MWGCGVGDSMGVVCSGVGYIYNLFIGQGSNNSNIKQVFYE